MFDIQETDEFIRWLNKLKDRQAHGTIISRINRLRHGNAGDVKTIGGGVRELRIHRGPGYRIYFVQHGETIIVLLCGGDKGSQDRDIQKAKQLATALKE